MTVTEQELKEWYNKKHEDYGEDAWRPLSAYKIILDHLKVQEGKTLLDIGCGTGSLLKLAEDKGVQTVGVDISDKAIEIAKQTSPKSEFKVGKGEELDLEDNQFDYVTCLGALEHFIDVDKAIEEMKRVGKPGVKLCIIVPNKNFLYWKIKKDKGTEQQAINERLWTQEQWKNFFARHNLKVIRTNHDDWHMHKIKVFSSKNPFKIVKSAALKTGWKLLPLNYTYQFVFILERAD